MAVRTVWIEPVIDRTQTDVDYLKSVALKIITTGFDSLTTDEELFWLLGSEEELSASDDLLGTVDGLQLIVYTRIIKGAWNITDLNRIEQNCKYLNEVFLERGYTCQFIPRSAEWIESDFPVMSEVDRIKQNVLWIADVLSVTTNITLGTEYLNYINANNIELGLYTTNVLLELMSSYFRKSGTFKSGQGVILP